MSFLRGKSTSYTRFALPKETTMQSIDKLVEALKFNGIPVEELEANGFVSYRNLLDAPVDRGLLPDHHDLWITGLRRDVKRAPAALVRAQTARELSDARTVTPNLSKLRVKEITAAVRADLHGQAQRRPSHAAVLVNLSTGILYVDGIASAHTWLAERLNAESLFTDPNVNADYLAWCAWRAGAGVDTPCSPTGDIAFLEPKDAGAQFDGSHNVDALLSYWMGEQDASIASLGLVFAVEDAEGDMHNVFVTLHANGLKVTGLEWPEEILNEPGDLDSKLARRLKFVTDFESALLDDIKEFADLAVQNKLPEKFLELTS